MFEEYFRSVVLQVEKIISEGAKEFANLFENGAEEFDLEILKKTINENKIRIDDNIKEKINKKYESLLTRFQHNLNNAEIKKVLEEDIFELFKW